MRKYVLLKKTYRKSYMITLSRIGAIRRSLSGPDRHNAEKTGAQRVTLENKARS
jgi:hypothetical protein